MIDFSFKKDLKNEKPSSLMMLWLPRSMGFDFQRYGGQKAYLQDLDGESGTEETSGTHCFNIYRSVNKCCNNIGCWSTVLVRNTFIPHSPHCLIRTINEIQIFYHISWCCSKARRVSAASPAAWCSVTSFIVAVALSMSLWLVLGGAQHPPGRDG